MLKHGEPSVDEINGWLVNITSHFSIPMRRIGYKHWQVDFRNSIAYYTLDIIDQGEWISYAVVLVHDVEGQGRVTFYRNLLELNAQLNGFHIGLENSKLILSGEVPKTSLNLSSFGNSIAYMDNAHKLVYPRVLQEIKRLGLKLIK